MDYTYENAVRRVAVVQILSAVNSGFPSHLHSLVTVQMREDAGEFIVVNVGTIQGLAYLIFKRGPDSLVNSPIVLRTFNKVY